VLDEHDQVDVWVSIKRKEEERRNVIGTSQFGDQERLIEMVRICGTTMEVEGSKPRRHLGRQWLDDVDEDMKRFGRMHCLGENGEGKLRQHLAN